MMKPVRVLYLTYNENPIGSGILRVQVRRMLEELASLDGVASVHWLAFLSPPLIKKLLPALPRFTEDLQSKCVTFRYDKMFAASAWGWPAIPVMRMATLPRLQQYVSKVTPDVIHSRSYSAGWLASQVARSTTVKHIFDPRGPYPEEMVLNRTWSKSGASYRIWKSIEDKLISDSDAVIGVTPQYRDEFKERHAKRPIFIPNRSDLKLLKQHRASLKQTPVFAFIGEMESHWYAPEYVGQHFLNALKVLPNAKCLVITRQGSEQIRERLIAVGIPREVIEVKGAPPEQAPGLLVEGTIGMVVQNFDNAWPVKFGEYLGLGLPVIMNRRAGPGICKVVENHKLGVVVDLDNPESYLPLADIASDWNTISERCRNYAFHRLDIRSTARQHLRLYRSLSSNSNA